MPAESRNSQLGLFDTAAPFVRDSDTSEAAAREIEPEASTLRAIVLAYIQGARGATCDEIEQVLGMRHQTASARVRELVLHDFVADSGKRRHTRSGRNAVVWIARQPAKEKQNGNP
jgi:predicted HTH transcriptional regulator